MRHFRIFIGVTLLTIAAVPAAYAQQTTQQDKAALKDNAYVTISGTVGDITSANTFSLNYKGGVIKVDTNDYWPNLFQKNASEVLKSGDKITVTGIVDDHFFTGKEIGATNIVYKGTDYSRLYSHAPYDMAYYGFWPYYGWTGTAYEEDAGLYGTISNILDKNDFQMKYGTGTVKVNTSGLGIADPDSLRVGDHVLVYGVMDDTWFGKRELDADYLVRTNAYQRR